MADAWEAPWAQAIKDTLNQLLAKHTGRPLDVVERDTAGSCAHCERVDSWLPLKSMLQASYHETESAGSGFLIHSLNRKPLPG